MVINTTNTLGRRKSRIQQTVAGENGTVLTSSDFAFLERHHGFQQFHYLQKLKKHLSSTAERTMSLTWELIAIFIRIWKIMLTDLANLPLLAFMI